MVHHKMASSHLTKRGDFWHYKRRVPKALARYDSRSMVYESTGVRFADDRAAIRAGVIAERINAEVEAYWGRLLAGDSIQASQRYEDSRERARELAFTYVGSDKLVEGQYKDILARLDKLTALGATESERDVAALLGGDSAPPIMLSSLVEAYEELVSSEIRNHSRNQLRKWRGHKQRAVLNLISVIGDKPITEITREEALDFRAWWQSRVLRDGLDNATANKDIGRLSAMFRKIEEQRRLGMSLNFAELRLGTGAKSRRPAYEPEFIERQFLMGKALAQLNDDARRVIYIMIETGLRPAEIVNLTADTIVLKADIPHVMIRPDDRVMKTDESKREIPLVGVALAAAKAQPNGFPRYRDKSDALSAAVNKFMSENGLRPTKSHVLYSLRHTFEDRLIAEEAPDKVIAVLMGHKFPRPRYGQGPSLEQKKKWLLKIAFKARPKVV